MNWFVCDAQKHKKMSYILVLCCPVLTDLRVQFILSKFHKFSGLFPLSLLLAPNSENIMKNLTVYLYKAFKLRSILSS